MSDRDTAVEIARITAAIASGEVVEEVGQQMINELRRATGTDDNVALDVVQTVGGHVLGVGSVASDAAEIVVGGIFDIFDD